MQRRFSRAVMYKTRVVLDIYSEANINKMRLFITHWKTGKKLSITL